jgi:CheY-like chemotaxis protein
MVTKEGGEALKSDLEFDPSSVSERGYRAYSGPEVLSGSTRAGEGPCWPLDFKGGEEGCKPRRRKALLAESDPDIRSLVHEMLTYFGMEVLATSGSRRAIEIWKAGEIVDLALIGSMPHSGARLDLVSRIRETNQNLPMVLMGEEDPGATQGKSGDDPYFRMLQMPFSIQSLEGAIQSLFEAQG